MAVDLNQQYESNIKYLTSLNSPISKNQRLFFGDINAVLSKLLRFWDIENGVLLEPEFQAFLDTTCTGYAVFARFAAGVWFGDNRYNFDLFQAMGCLDPDLQGFILEWINEPYKL